jgi:hypothetical protein
MRYWLTLGSLCCLTAGAWLLAAEPGFAQRVATGAGGASYQSRLEAWTQARDAFEAQAGPYWQSIADKRRIRFAKFRSREPAELNDYVLTQPPLYNGPPRPVDPDAPRQPSEREPMPVLADFLKAAVDHYHFTPQRPQNDLDFKRAYAAAARASGLSRDQVVRIYSFETGGNGSYEVQAGLTHPGPKARAISTAMGYNQLLTTNTVSILAEHGDHILGILRQWSSRLSGEERSAMERKIEVLRRMIAVSRGVPRHWNEHDKLAKTSRGYGMHALLLDRDIGPLLQVQKLLNSIQHARTRGVTALTAAELEMMNLTGDGNGFDLVTMAQELRDKVPTSNFFQRGGYERNGIARRTATVAGLYAEMNGIMDRMSQQPGARELASAY